MLTGAFLGIAMSATLMTGCNVAADLTPLETERLIDIVETADNFMEDFWDKYNTRSEAYETLLQEYLAEIQESNNKVTKEEVFNKFLIAKNNFMHNLDGSRNNMKFTGSMSQNFEARSNFEQDLIYFEGNYYSYTLNQTNEGFGYGYELLHFTSEVMLEGNLGFAETAYNFVQIIEDHEDDMVYRRMSFEDFTRYISLKTWTFAHSEIELEGIVDFGKLENGNYFVTFIEDCDLYVNLIKYEFNENLVNVSQYSADTKSLDVVSMLVSCEYGTATMDNINDMLALIEDKEPTPLQEG